MANMFNGFASIEPKIKAKRSMFPMTPSRSLSFNLGEIVPLQCVEVMPDDTFTCDVTSVIHMMTLQRPIFTNLFYDVYSFYVPFRILWKNYEAFEGAPEPQSWNDNVQGTLTIPQIDFGDCPVQRGDLAHHLGLPIGFDGKVTALKFRGLALIYNDKFRNQNVEASHNTFYEEDNDVVRSDYLGVPTDEDTGIDASRIAPFDPLALWSPDSEDGLNALAMGALPPHIYKARDVFTTALPAPQKGEPLSISLAGTAPVVTGTAHQNLADLNSNFKHQTYAFQTGSDNVWRTSSNNFLLGVNQGGYAFGGIHNSDGTLYNSVPDNLVAQLNDVSVVTINQLREAFALQRVLEAWARGGTRMKEILLNIWGLSVPDYRLQEPEYLGGHRGRINMNTVVQTSNNADETSPTGTMYGNSKTVNSSHIINATFKERGYVYTFIVCRQEHTYSQGVDKSWTRKNRMDFYNPYLAHLGEEAVKKSEIYYSNPNDNAVLGYQERWYDYRYIKSYCSGDLDPNTTDGGGTLSNWSAADLYDSAPSLTPKFLKETGVFLDRTLTLPHWYIDGDGVTQLGPDQFFADVYFAYYARRPMPVRSTPGNI